MKCTAVCIILKCQVYFSVHCITACSVLPCAVYYRVQCITMCSVLQCAVHHIDNGNGPKAQFWPSKLIQIYPNSVKNIQTNLLTYKIISRLAKTIILSCTIRTAVYVGSNNHFVRTTYLNCKDHL